MGLLIDGRWHDQWYNTDTSAGRFIRSEAQFRHWITPDGAPGPTGEGGFPAARGRYHLYVGLACPWAHRTMIFRRLKGLEEHISLSVVHWYMAEQGWSFAPGEGVVADPNLNARYLYEIYTAAAAGYSGRVTIPVLWDRERATIVNNESAEIIRMLNSAFDGCGALAGDYYPPVLRAEIDAVNTRVYEQVNNGVYRAGFATSQEAYDEAVGALFGTLDWLEERLQDRRYLCGEQLTEADWRLFTTLIRFDAVYHYHFKCNLKRIRDYPLLHDLMMRLYAMAGIAETVDLTHIKGHYFASHKTINSSGIIPRGPLIPF